MESTASLLSFAFSSWIYTIGQVSRFLHGRNLKQLHIFGHLTSYYGRHAVGNYAFHAAIWADVPSLSTEICGLAKYNKHWSLISGHIRRHNFQPVYEFLC